MRNVKVKLGEIRIFVKKQKHLLPKWVPLVKPCKNFATNSTLTNCGSKDLQHATKEKHAKKQVFKHTN